MRGLDIVKMLTPHPLRSQRLAKHSLTQGERANALAHFVAQWRKVNGKPGREMVFCADREHRDNCPAANTFSFSFKLRHDVLGKRQRRGQAGRFDAEQIDQPRHAVVRGTHNQKVGLRFAGTAQLRPDAGIIRH